MSSVRGRSSLVAEKSVPHRDIPGKFRLIEWLPRTTTALHRRQEYSNPEVLWSAAPKIYVIIYKSLFNSAMAITTVINLKIKLVKNRLFKFVKIVISNSCKKTNIRYNEEKNREVLYVKKLIFATGKFLKMKLL